jgi:hypothetical protein
LYSSGGLNRLRACKGKTYGFLVKAFMAGKTYVEEVSAAIAEVEDTCTIGTIGNLSSTKVKVNEWIDKAAVSYASSQDTALEIAVEKCQKASKDFEDYLVTSELRLLVTTLFYTGTNSSEIFIKGLFESIDMFFYVMNAEMIGLFYMVCIMHNFLLECSLTLSDRSPF